MDFPLKFRTWLDSVAPQLTSGVAAFSFNLYEPAFVPGVRFGVELIGAGTFSSEDQDWPCDEIWEPNPRGIDIPEQFSGTSWESCLERIKALTTDYMSSATGAWLHSSDAVGIGFVDGDLEVIWARVS